MSGVKVAMGLFVSFSHSNGFGNAILEDWTRGPANIVDLRKIQNAIEENARKNNVIVLSWQLMHT